MIPPVRSRYYSVSSCQRVTPQRLELTVSRLTYSAPDGTVKRGTCSTYLAEARPGDRVSFRVIRVPLFRLPVDPTAPVVLVSAGTGLAPFRAFWLERAARATAAAAPITNAYTAAQAALPGGLGIGRMLFIHGCRSNAALMYRDEMARYLNDAPRLPAVSPTAGEGGNPAPAPASATPDPSPSSASASAASGSRSPDAPPAPLPTDADVLLALSREPHRPKQYVQDVVASAGPALAELLTAHPKAAVFVCGDSNMAEAVRDAFTKVLGPDTFASLVKSHRYHEDVFGVTLHVGAVASDLEDARAALAVSAKSLLAASTSAMNGLTPAASGSAAPLAKAASLASGRKGGGGGGPAPVVPVTSIPMAAERRAAVLAQSLSTPTAIAPAAPPLQTVPEVSKVGCCG